MPFARQPNPNSVQFEHDVSKRIGASASVLPVLRRVIREHSQGIPNACANFAHVLHDTTSLAS